jgi:hypothetical protein
MNKNELDKDQAALDGLYKKAIKKKPAAVKLKNPINYRDDYHRRTLSEAVAKINEVNHLPISERKENAAEFLRDLKHPAMIAERVKWLIDGSYGHGEMLKAKQIIASPRMNRRGSLTHLIGIYEWNTPIDMGVAQWKKLSHPEKIALDAALDRVIKDAEQEMLEEQG